LSTVFLTPLSITATLAASSCSEPLPRTEPFPYTRRVSRTGGMVLALLGLWGCRSEKLPELTSENGSVKW
jgi:hypothetical protein